MQRDLRSRTFGVATHRAAGGDVAAPVTVDGLHPVPADDAAAQAAVTPLPPVAPNIDHHNRVTALAAQRAWDELEPRLAELIAPVLRGAGRTAARRFRQHASRAMTAAAYRASDELRLAALTVDARRALLLSLAVTAAGPPGMASNSTMVCVMPTAAQQADLAIGDQDAAILHVTLVYLGEYDGPLNVLASVLAPVAATFAPLHGTVAGRGTFGDNVQLLLPDVPGLVELRVAVTEALVAAGIDYARDHGYLSHITVSYTPTAAADVVGAPLDFADLMVVRGNTEVVALPFVGVPPVTAAASGGDSARATQAAELTQSVAAQQAEAARLEQQARAAARAAASVAEATQIRSAMDRVDEALRILGTAQHSGDPERILTAQRALQVAQDDLQRTLQSAQPPGGPGPGGPSPTPLPPGQVQPAGSPQPLPSKVELPPPQEVGKEIRKQKAQKLFGPPDTRGGIGGMSVDQLLEQEAFMEAQKTNAIPTVEPPDWTRPAGDELLDPEALMRQVRGVTDPVRQAVIRSVGTPIVENAGIGWNDANPFAARVLAQSASQVTHITETTQAHLMQIIDTAYNQGLTIPDTAKLIQQHMAEATPARARLIARTELAGAVNGGSLAATQIVQQATGTQYRKTWLTAPGAPHPRHENYTDLDGQQADLDGYFQVGDARLQYPGDPAGPPEEICNCRCTLTYVEAATDDNGGAAAETDALGVPTTPDATTIEPLSVSTSDPMTAARLLADGDNVMLEHPDEIATMLDDLGRAAAEAQQAGNAAANLDLGRVSVAGTNLFTQDSLGIPRIDMPQLKGDPIKGSLADAMPRDKRGEVDIAPLFYKYLRDQGINIRREDALVSHLRATQKELDGQKVAGIMDAMEKGVKIEGAIPVSRDGYVIDGHHRWAAEVGIDYKSGLDAGLKMEVDRIDEPVTKILAQANAFAKHYGIPQASAFVPKVADTHVAANLARPINLAEGHVALPGTSDTVLGITPFRPEDNPVGFYDSAKAKQFEADLSPVADEFGVTITSSDRVTGVWQGSTEPAYSVRAHDGETGVAKFAETMRARYDQDGVLIFRPADGGHDFEFTIHGTNPTQALPRLVDYGVDGATVVGDDLVLIGDESMGASAARIAKDFGGDVTYRQGELSFAERHVAADYLASTARDPYLASLQKELAATSRKIQRLELKGIKEPLALQEEQRLRDLNRYRDSLRGYIAAPNPAEELANLQALIDIYGRAGVGDRYAAAQLRMLTKRQAAVQDLLAGTNAGTARVAAKAQGTRAQKPVAKSSASLLDPTDTPAGWGVALADVPDRQAVQMAPGVFTADGYTYAVGPSVVWRDHGIVFRKELPSVEHAAIADPAKVAAQAQTVTGHFLDGVPPEVAGSVHNINIFEGRNPEDEVWAREYNMPGFLSGAASADGEMTFWNANRTDLPTPSVTQQTFEHEIGHLAGFQGGPIDSYDWVNAANTDALANRARFHLNPNTTDESYVGIQASDFHGFLVGTRGVSDYGSNSIQEDWAETMRLYLLNKRAGNIGLYRGERVTLEGMFPARAAQFEKQLHLPALGAEPRVGSKPA